MAKPALVAAEPAPPALPPPALLTRDLQPMVQGALQTLWSFRTTASLDEVRDLAFLRHCTLMLRAGDQMIFSAGPAEHQVHGTLAVLQVTPAHGGKPGEPSWPAEVLTAVIARTP